MPTPSAAAEGVGTVVSPAWLADAVKEKERRVRVLDCSWYLPAMARDGICLLYTSPSPRDGLLSRMPSSA